MRKGDLQMTQGTLPMSLINPIQATPKRSGRALQAQLFEVHRGEARKQLLRKAACLIIGLAEELGVEVEADRWLCAARRDAAAER